MAWEKDPPHLQPSKGYLRVRRVNRAIMDTWFREISIVDIDTLPEEGGIIYTAWHPGGLIDPMLMMAALPGGLTFAAKSTLFNIPVLSRIMKWINVQPVQRAQDNVGSDEDRKKANSALIDTLAELVANGERIAIFPEGMSHTESHAVEIKTGAARILLERFFKRFFCLLEPKSANLCKKVEGGHVSNPRFALFPVVVILKSSVTRVTELPSRTN